MSLERHSIRRIRVPMDLYQKVRICLNYAEQWLPVVSFSPLLPEVDMILSVSAVSGKVAGIIKSRLIGVEQSRTSDRIQIGDREGWSEVEITRMVGENLIQLTDVEEEDLIKANIDDSDEKSNKNVTEILSINYRMKVVHSF